ncbi:MAG: AraC family transcriptional regulator [Bacteroidota bacterium]
MQFPIYHIFILFGSGLGIILGFLFLFSKFFQSRPNKFLAITLFSLAITGLNYCLLSTGTTNNYLVLINDIMWEYLFPTTLLFYFLAVVKHPFMEDKRRFYLYLPFFLTLLINVIINLDVDFGLYHSDLINNESIRETYYVIEDIGTIVFTLVLTYFSWKIINTYPSPIPSNWLREFWWWTAILIACWVVIWLLDILASLDFVEQLFNALSVFYFWVTYRGVFQFKLAEEKFEIRKILATEALEPPQESSTNNPLFLRLEKLMQEEHLYRDPELNRDQLAQKLGISTGYLSQRINQDSGLNFSDYVNTYRIAEVKRMLVDPKFEPYSLLSIGYEAGFNSKSTFYAAFKKVAGMSPSAYKQLKVA